jgi:hypothetical protein
MRQPDGIGDAHYRGDKKLTHCQLLVKVRATS